jgi:mycothiol synthase
MRRPLPHPDRSAVATRAFVPGVDDVAWLAVNNRAFADHGEQGGWTEATLALRIAEPWFDADGFRLHEVDGRLVGFCWTKVHADTDPPLGEIYAIAVDPDAHGRGLGRELTLAGLDSLADRGIRHANLYVDAANAAAVRVYERLGFTVHRTRSAYSGTLGGS